MTMVNGQSSEGKGIVAQVCDVHRPLMSVKRMCKVGHRVVFDDEESYVENKSREHITITEEDGDYVLDAWVKIEAEDKSTFGGPGIASP